MLRDTIRARRQKVWPLCRGTSQAEIKGLVCKSETVKKKGEMDEMGERENLCWWSVSGAAKDET